MRRLSALCALPVLLGCGQSAAPLSQEASASPASATPVLDLASGTTTTLAAARQRLPRLSLVRLHGEARHFGYDLASLPPRGLGYHATVAGAKVRIAEIPLSRLLGLQTDSVGQWDLWILKRADDTLRISLVFEKDFHPAATETAVFGAPLPDGWNVSRGKTNVVDVVDRDILDLGMQLPDELYLSGAKARLEAQIGKMTGSAYSIRNLAVVTVGKRWASLFSDSLPHGDPGAVATATPAPTNPLQGPVYFDRSVQPDPALKRTSVDGGVLFNNIPVGTFAVTATKTPWDYPAVRFEIEPDIAFYVASPPHSVQGSNTSLPGED